MKSTWIVAAAAFAIAGCSGGAPTSTTSTGGTATPSDLLIAVSTTDPNGLHDVSTDTATVTVTAVDAQRNVLPGAPVSIVPDATAVVTVSGTTTDSTGVVTGNIGIGADRTNRTIGVVVKSGSITKTLTINVIGAKLTATLNPAVITPGANGSIQYHLVDANNAAIPGIAVAVSGAFSANGMTDTNGDFVYSYVAPAQEQVLAVNATAAGAQVSSSITDAAGTIGPAQGTVQSATLDGNPTTIATNLPGSTTNQVALRASFFDALNAPITNIRVRFDLDGDLGNIGGTLSSGTNFAYSDTNGVARAAYTPGTRSSGNGQVTIRACWDNNDFAVGTCPHALTTPLTVVSEGVNITVNSDNKIIVLEESPVIYELAYSVLVVDSAGNPKANVPVSYSVAIPQYYKGFWPKAGSTWGNQVWEACGNEDINGNNRLDDFEDYNADGLLEPSGTATILPQSVGADVTDAFGRAHFFLQYGANYATWADYTLTFSASVAGSAGHYTMNGTLPALADAFSEPSLPFEESPFGTDTSSFPVKVTDPVSGKSANLCYLGVHNQHGPWPQ